MKPKKVKCPKCDRMITKKFMGFHMKVKHPTTSQQILANVGEGKSYKLKTKATPFKKLTTIEDVLAFLDEQQKTIEIRAKKQQEQIATLSLEFRSLMEIV